MSSNEDLSPRCLDQLRAWAFVFFIRAGFNRCVAEQLAQDLVSDVWVFSQYPGHGICKVIGTPSFRPYVKQMAYNRKLDEWSRAHKERRTLTGLADATLPRQSDRRLLTESDSFRQECLHRLRRAVRDLKRFDPVQGSSWSLHYESGHRWRNVAQQVHTTTNAARQHGYHFNKRLRRYVSLEATHPDLLAVWRFLEIHKGTFSIVARHFPWCHVDQHACLVTKWFREREAATNFDVYLTSQC
jgi:DNA-directed RNA polymerase specialized sigma24 family protein